jgi:ATP-dependent Clp protease ATP-binding subunit ClpA
MKGKSHKETVNFLKSLESLLQNDAEFASQYLESRGFDPESTSNSIEEMTSKLILKKKAELAKASLQNTFERAKKMLVKIAESSASELKGIESLFNEKIQKEYALNFRDLKSMDKAEALKILNDIEILELLEKGFKDDDSKNPS